MKELQEKLKPIYEQRQAKLTKTQSEIDEMKGKLTYLRAKPVLEALLADHATSLKNFSETHVEIVNKQRRLFTMEYQQIG